MKKEDKIIFNIYIELGDILSKFFGEDCEVVIHDLQYPEKSIIRIFNGHVTGRKKGDPLTDLGLKAMHDNFLKKGNKKTNKLVSYRTETKNGKPIKSAALLIKNGKKKLVGCFCLNYDLTKYIFLNKITKEFVPFIDKKDSKLIKRENFYNDVNLILENIIFQSMEKIGKPVNLMNKNDKLEIIKKVDDNGGLLIKGSIGKLAELLNCSRFTIYNYLKELKIKM